MTYKQEFITVATRIGLWEQDDSFASANDYLADIDNRCPPVKMFVTNRDQVALRAIRRVFRWFAGKDWASFNETIEPTGERVFEQMLPMFFELYAAGIMCGRQNNDLIFKHRENWEFLSESEELRMESSLLGSTFETETEFSDVIKHCFKESGRAFYEMTAMEAMPDTMTYKVWDLWFYTHQIVSTAMFVVGWELGKEKREEDLFKSLDLPDE